MKQYKIIFSSICILLFNLNAYCQQQGQYSQYMMNYFLINPAVAGTEDYLEIKCGFRKQWTGISDAPQNYYVTASMPLNKINRKMAQGKQNKNHHSVGFMATGQTLGILAHNIALINYAYHLSVSKNSVLAFGVDAGANHMWADNSKAKWGDNIPDYESIYNVNKLNFDLGLGLWFYNKKLFCGVSTKQTPESSFDNGFDRLLNVHVYATGGYKLALNQDWTYIPSLLFKGTSNAYQVDVNNKFKFDNRMWFGMSYRHTDAVAALAGVSFPVGKTKKANTAIVEIGYSYDYTLSKLNIASYGSHEIMIGLLLPKAGKMVCADEFW